MTLASAIALLGTKKRIGPKQPRFFAMKSWPANIRSNGSIVTPEPSSYALMTAGLAVVGVVSRRRRA